MPRNAQQTAEASGVRRDLQRVSPPQNSLGVLYFCVGGPDASLLQPVQCIDAIGMIGLYNRSHPSRQSKPCTLASEGIEVGDEPVLEHSVLENDPYRNP